MPDELDVIFPDLQGLLSADWDQSPGSPLARDPEHGGVTAESLDGYLRSRLGTPLIGGVETSGGGTTTPVAPPSPRLETPPPETPPEPEVLPDGDDDEEEAPEAPVVPEPEEGEPPAPPPGPASYDLGGRTYSREQLEAIATFSSELDGDPVLQEVLRSYYTGRLENLAGRLQPQPAAAPVAPPPFAQAPDLSAPAPAAYVPSNVPLDEYADPRIAQLIQVAQQQQAQIDRLTQAHQVTAQQSIARSNMEAEALISRAARSFQEEHNLTDSEITDLRRFAGRLGHINALMAGIDPMTGAPSRPDLLAATDRALEIAYYATPAFRQREIDAALERQQARTRKRQRLAGVGGSSGSVSRTPSAPAPGTQDARSSMIREVGEMLSGTWSEPA